MTQAISVPRMILYGTFSAIVIGSIGWIGLPDSDRWGGWRIAILISITIISFILGARIEVQAHAKARKGFENREKSRPQDSSNNP